MNDQLWFEGSSFQGLSNRLPVRTDQLWFDGEPFEYLFQLNTAPNNFWLLFE